MTFHYSLGQRVRAAVATSLGGAILLVAAMACASSGASRFAMLEGNRVHYTDFGSGDFALVFVHGWNCDESVWKEQAPTLSKNARVITVDLLGHGKSDAPPVAYTFDLQARAIEAVLEDAGVTSAVLVGHSNGTPVVRQFYRLFPSKVRGLVMVDGALRTFGNAATMEKFIAPLRGRDYAETATRFIEGMTGPIKDTTEREEIKAMMLRGREQVAVSEMEALLAPELWEPTKIEVPVLMIMAKQPAWTADYEEFVRSFIPNLDYQMWEGVSHFVMQDKPAEFNRAVRQFLQKNALAESFRNPPPSLAVKDETAKP